MASPVVRATVEAQVEVLAILWPSRRSGVGYDNERGKGDHRHFQGAESAYAFSTVEQLMADFWSDVRALRGGK